MIRKSTKSQWRIDWSECSRCTSTLSGFERIQRNCLLTIIEWSCKRRAWKQSYTTEQSWTVEICKHVWILCIIDLWVLLRSSMNYRNAAISYMSSSLYQPLESKSLNCIKAKWVSILMYYILLKIIVLFMFHLNREFLIFTFLRLLFSVSPGSFCLYE